ncbi:hypothetical protein E1265_32725 [Streptomyces sp. 8K308]|nr:hypothetical protein E1265_32725 [Streptomyces sp. 8K308]
MTDNAASHDDGTDATAALPELAARHDDAGADHRGSEAAAGSVPAPGGRRAAHRAVRRTGRRRYLLASLLGVAVLGVTVAEVGDVGLPPALNPIGSGGESEAAATPSSPEATAEASESAEDVPIEQVTDSDPTDPDETPSDDESADESPEETTQPPVEEDGSIATSPAPTTSVPDPDASDTGEPEPDSPSPTEPGEPEPDEPAPSPTEDDCWWIFC